MYGHNSQQLRNELTTLIGQARRGHTAPETDVRLVGRYRHAVLLWCQQAVRASNPVVDLGGTTPRSRGPAEELSHRLSTAHATIADPLPTLDDLTSPHNNGQVETWRLAARAAALGEHDFPAGLTYGHLSDEQAMTVLKDAAEITRALVGIDRHHHVLPGWESLPDHELLGRAAVVCAAHAGYTRPDYSVDRRGWRPPVALTDGPALPGLRGVLQAQNNLLVHLAHQPDGHSLRLILDSQRIVSRHTADLADTDSRDGFGEKWAARHDTYDKLIEQSRNLRGLVGDGGHAAGQAALAASRATALTRNAGDVTTPPDHRELRHLDSLNTHIDRRLAGLILTGADDRSYLLRVGIPRLDTTTGGPVKQQRTRHIPLDIPGSEAPLLGTVRGRLRPRISVTEPMSVRGDSGRERFSSAMEAGGSPHDEQRSGLSL